MKQAYILSLLLAAVLTIAALPPIFAASCGYFGNDIRALGTRRVSCGPARSMAVSWAGKYRADPAHRQPIRVTKRVPHQEDTITWSYGHQTTLPLESTVAVRCRTSHTLIAFTYVLWQFAILRRSRRLRAVSSHSPQAGCEREYQSPAPLTPLPSGATQLA